MTVRAARRVVLTACWMPWQVSLGVWLRRSLMVLASLVLVLAGTGRAYALKSIELTNDLDMVDISADAEILGSRGDSIQVDTAPDAENMTGRMSVRASVPGLSPNWLVFALRNSTERPIERWVTAQRYSLIGSGIIWPDLDSRRIETVTPSLGFLPERVRSDRADIFKVTLEPGQTVTYVAELATDRFSRVQVWKPVEYELKARERQLYNGILLGITGVLGIFLTAVFVANHKPIFPTAALVTWCVLAYLCVDFGFWHKLFQLRPEDNSVYRAATEAAMAASILVFLRIFLRLTAAPGLARMLLGVWIIVQLGLVAMAFIDAQLAATFARVSFAVIGSIGIVAIAYLALLGQDRALALLPSWILFLVWLFAAAVTLTGRLQGDAVVSSLTGGLVLITVLMGFTVTQFAFRSLDSTTGAAPGEQTVRSLAVDAAGASVWEWSVRRDQIKAGRLVEAALGLNAGELNCNAESFCGHLHPADRERFRLLLWSVKEHGGGEIRLELRMLHADNSYRWFDLEAAAVPAADRRALRCVGLLRDVTEAKRAQERLLHDAVRDSLTGLPNRELFLDRLGVSVARAKNEPMILPAVVLIDVDKFRSVNNAYGLVVGDSLLLTLARRLQRHLGTQDTLARTGGNQFAVLLMQAHDALEVAEAAENIRRSVRSPIAIAGQEVVLTAALGIAIWDNRIPTAEELLKDAEIAMYRAKRSGADRAETFRAEMRNEADNRIVLESEIVQALEKRELVVLYQPIIALATEELAGFEALVRWQHPRLGLIGPDVFIPIAEESDLIVRLGSYVLTRAVEDAASWHKLLPRVERALFVSVNISSRQLFRADLVQEIRQIVGRALLPPGGLRLELTESLVMENPERAVEVLEWLRSAGAGLSLDDFGTGYSSLAYLHRFPFDTIKIDRDLVQAATADGNGAAIVRSMVALTHELGKKVVAEGVELQTDVAFLRSIGCEYAQGYYYGEAIAQRDVERMLRVVRKNEKRVQSGLMFGSKTRRKEAKAARQADALKIKAARNKGEAETAGPAGDAAVAATAAAAGSMTNGAAVTAPAMQYADGDRGFVAPAARDAPPSNGYTFNGHGYVEPGYAGLTPPILPPGAATVTPSTWPTVPYTSLPERPLEGLADLLASATGRDNDAAYLSPANAPPPFDPPAHPFPETTYPATTRPDVSSAQFGNGGTNGYDDTSRHQALPPGSPYAPRPSRQPQSAATRPDLSNLPPAIAASLKRLSRTKEGTGSDGGGSDGGV